MLFILIQLIKKLYHNHHHQYIEKKEQSLEIFAVSYTAAHHIQTYLIFLLNQNKNKQKSSIPYQPLLSRPPAMFCPQIQTAIHIL